jgi:cytoskeletal protein CcmA (bactofilin family)
VSLFGRPREESTPEEPSAPPVAAPPRPPAQPARAAERGPRQGEEMANIGKSISIKGDLSGNEDLVIEGKVEGKVELPNNQLTIGANGLAKAEINAKSVVVIGKVAGNVRGTERIEIQATGIVDGDVAAPRLVVAEGAVLNGSIQMTSKTGATGSIAPTAHPQPLAAAGGSKG